MEEIGRTRIERLGDQDRQILDNLFQFYLYDMSEFFPVPLCASGRFQFDMTTLDQYWSDEEHIPYLIKYDGEIAGFLLARRYPPNTSVWDIDQFFVLRKYRRLGCGQHSLEQCLQQHPGEWQIRVLFENTPAYAFWERSVSKITDRDFTVAEELDDDLAMYFFRFEYESR